jgi:FkbM family methyltransferase
MTEVATRYGRLTVPDTQTDTIGVFLARYGEWAWIEASFVAPLLRDGDRVLDVGAFAGTFGLGVAQSRALGFLCLVEANPLMAPLLAANVAGNSSCPVAVVEALVTGPDGVARAGHFEPGNLGSATFRQDADGEPVPASVRSVTLADLRAEHGQFDLIKVDVEGMELEVLQGDAGRLIEGQTTLWVECNETERSLRVAELLLSWGLDLYYFAFPSFNPGNFNHDPDPVFPFAFEAALLAAPKVRPALTAEQAALGCILTPVESLGDLRDALWRTPRWGLPEWTGATTMMELAARVGRSLRNETRATFLSPEGTIEPARTVWQRMEETESALLNITRLFEAERVARGDIESRLAAEQAEAAERARFAEAAALDATHLLQAERDARNDIEIRLATEQAQAAELAERARVAETALSRASSRGLAHLAALGALREHVAAQAERLHAEQVQADIKMVMLEHRLREAAETERHLVTQTLLAAAEAEQTALRAAGEAALSAERERTRLAEQTLADLRASTVWRLSAPLRRFVDGLPWLHALLRRGRAAAGALRRRLRRRRL